MEITFSKNLLQVEWIFYLKRALLYGSVSWYLNALGIRNLVNWCKLHWLEPLFAEMTQKKLRFSTIGLNRTIPGAFTVMLKVKKT